jgi:hypothetical protein
MFYKATAGDDPRERGGRVGLVCEVVGVLALTYRVGLHVVHAVAAHHRVPVHTHTHVSSDAYRVALLPATLHQPHAHAPPCDHKEQAYLKSRGMLRQKCSAISLVPQRFSTADLFTNGDHLQETQHNTTHNTQHKT